MKALHTEIVGLMLNSYSYSIHIRYRTSAYFIDKLTKVIRIDGGLKQIFSSE